MASRLASSTTRSVRPVSALARASQTLNTPSSQSQTKTHAQKHSLPAQRRGYQNSQLPPQFQQFQQPQIQEFAPPPPPPPPRRWRFRIFTLNRCLFLFATTASYLSADYYLNNVVFVELNASKPVTASEIRTAARVQQESIAHTDTFEFVQMMKADPDWEEWRMDASGGPSSESAATTGRVRLTTGPMGGVDGMGCGHRIFRHQPSGTIVSIVHIGQSLSGWPWVVHGGALATILDEALGRCAIQLFAAGTAVTARLSLNYKRPSMVRNYFVITCTPDLPEGVELKDGKLDQRKVWCNASLAPVEPSGEVGPPNVSARALFVVPQSYNLPKVEQRF